MIVFSVGWEKVPVHMYTDKHLLFWYQIKDQMPSKDANFRWSVGVRYSICNISSHKTKEQRNNLLAVSTDDVTTRGLWGGLFCFLSLKSLFLTEQGLLSLLSKVMRKVQDPSQILICLPKYSELAFIFSFLFHVY